MPQQPTTTQRGYGWKHQQLRKKWKPKVATGTVRCWRCGRFIAPNEPWDLGHDDLDRSIYRGPEHRACNRDTIGNLRDALTGRTAQADAVQHSPRW